MMLSKLPLAMGGLALASLLVAAWSPLLAAPPALRPDAPEVYHVRPGDSLWGIAGRFLRDPWRWSEVWEGNPGVADPNLIYPGDRLLLDTRRPGRPRVRQATAEAPGGLRVVKLSPRVRVTELDTAVPAIPVDAIEPFLSRAWVAETRALEDAPEVVGFPRERLLAGTGDRLFARPLREAREAGYAILRPGAALRDPSSQEVLGYPARFVAEARLERTGDPAILRVTKAVMPVRLGDRVRPARAAASALRPFLPQPAPAGLKGHLLAGLDEASRIGQYACVVLDRGARQGL
ncbi:MAG: LysM peptidoglycan-binding domain-containing protein, partial [Halochromatium sp.]